MTETRGLRSRPRRNPGAARRPDAPAPLPRAHPSRAIGNAALARAVSARGGDATAGNAEAVASTTETEGVVDTARRTDDERRAERSTAAREARGVESGEAAPGPAGGSAGVATEEEEELQRFASELETPPELAEVERLSSLVLAPPAPVAAELTRREFRPAGAPRLDVPEPPATEHVDPARIDSARSFATHRYDAVVSLARRQHVEVETAGASEIQAIAWAYDGAASRLLSAFQRADATAELDFERALSHLGASARSADRAVLVRYVAGRRRLFGAAAAANNAVRRNAETANAQIQAIQDELSREFVGTLDDAAAQCDREATAATNNLRRWRGNIDENFPTADVDLKVAVENEAKAAVGRNLVRQALTELQRRSRVMRSNFETNTRNVKTSIRNRVAPTLLAYAAGIREHGQASVTKAFQSSFRALKEQANEARAANARTHDEAVKSLVETRRAERERLQQQAEREMEALQAETVAATDAVRSAVEAALPHYAGSVGKLADTLTRAAAQGHHSLRHVATSAPPAVEEALLGARALQNQQLQLIGSGARDGLARREAAAVSESDAAVAATAQSLDTSTGSWTAGMFDSVESMTEGFSSVADGVTAAAEAWATPFAEKYAELIENERKALTEDLPTFKKTVKTNADKFLDWVRPQGDPDVFFRDQLNAAGTAAWTRVTEAVSGLSKSLDAGIIDTVNEEGVSDALRGLTALQGKAVRQRWAAMGTPHIAETPFFQVVTKRQPYSLDNHLLFALGEGTADYNSAINYLNGDVAAGARYELQASIHWYNDEEARIEKVMRALTPEQLQQVHDLDKGETLADVRDALGGTDLDVFDALREGNHAKADALRMREALIDARASYDKEAINKVLEQYSTAAGAEQYGGEAVSAEERRARVQREFALLQGVDIEARAQEIVAQNQTAAGGPAAGSGPGTATFTATAIPSAPGADTAATEPPKPSEVLREMSFAPVPDPQELARQQAAGEVLFQYATRDMTRQRGSTREGDYRIETIRFEGAERDLAHALVFHGDKSPEARAARLGIEVQRGGRPNAVNLDTALVDPRLNPNLRHDVSAEALKALRAQALREREQTLRLFAQRYGGAGADVKLEDARNELSRQLTQAYGSDKVGAQLARLLVEEEFPSPATNAVAMQYAVEGAGTNNELIDRVLPRMNRDEIQLMRRQYKLNTGRELYADLGVYGHGWFGDLSGDDRLRAERQLRGRPRNDRERFEAAAYAIHQQREETGIVGGWLASGSLQERQLDFEERQLGGLAGADITFGPEGEAVWSGTGAFDRENAFTGDASDFAATTTGAHLAAQNYSQKIDQYANFASMTVAIIGAVAAAVATVLTGGAASPLLMAAIAGITGLAAMGTQALIKGGRYGWEQAAVDLGMTAVQALTAGVGQKLALASRGLGSAQAARDLAARQAMGQAAQIGRTGQIIGEMGHLTGNAFADKVLIGMGTGALGSLGQTAIDENTWAKGAAAGVENLFAGLFRGALTGGVTAGVTNALEDLPLNRVPGLRTVSSALGKDTIGEAVGASTSVFGRGLGKGLTSGAGAFAGRGVELGYESARGKYRGDAGDIFVSMLEAGAQAAAQGTLEGGFEAPAQARYQRARQRAAEGRVPPTAPETEPVATRAPSTREIPEQAHTAARPPVTPETAPPPRVGAAPPEGAELAPRTAAATPEADGGERPRPTRGQGGGDGEGDGRPPRPLTPEEQRRFEILETMLSEVEARRGMAPRGGRVDEAFEQLPETRPPALRRGERIAGRSEISPAVARSLRARARRAFGLELQDALSDPSRHTALTLKTLEYLTPDQIDHVLKTGRLPRGFEFDHFMTVADFPEFAHRADVGAALPKDVHREAAHGGDTTRPREALTMIEPEAETRPPFHRATEGAEPSPHEKPLKQQIAEGLAAGEDIDQDILIGQRAELARMEQRARTATGASDPDLRARIEATRAGIAELERIVAARTAEPSEGGARPAAPPVGEALPGGDKSGTAAAIRESEFRGDLLEQPHPQAVEAIPRAAERLVAPEASTSAFARVEDPADPSRLVVTLDGGEEVRVRVVVNDTMPPEADGSVPVARYQQTAAGEYVVEVSSKVRPHMVERALAHELTEIRFAHRGEAVPNALAPGGFGSASTPRGASPKLSPHDHGRLAELDVLVRQIEAAQATGDTRRVAQLRDETQRLFAHMGMVDDTPAAQTRRDVAIDALAERPEAQRLLAEQSLRARENPFLEITPTDPREYVDHLLDRLAYARELGDTARERQVLEQARGKISFRGDGKVVFFEGAEGEKVGYHIGWVEKHAGDPKRPRTAMLKELIDDARRNRAPAVDPFQRDQASNKLPDPTDVDPDHAEAIRRRFADQRHFQDWAEFRDAYLGKNFGFRRADADRLRTAYELWSRGQYATGPGRSASLAAASRRPEVTARFEHGEKVRPEYTPVSEADVEGVRRRTGRSIDELIRERNAALEESRELRERLKKTVDVDERKKIADRLNELIPVINTPTERLGEAAAVSFARQALNVPDVEPTRGAGVPDLIFEDPATGRLVVVEAKGGDSPLSARLNADGTRMVQQGTPEYLESLALAMQRSTDERIRKLGFQLEEALSDPTAPEVDYFVVRQPFHEDGSLGAPTVAKFNIIRSRNGR